MKTIALFGGTGGLGSQLAPLLSKDYKVIILGSRSVDITNYYEVENFFNEMDIDIVINLSGYSYDSFAHKYSEHTYLEIDKQLDINIRGTINVATCALPKMREKNYGRLILMSSVLADHPVVSTSIYAGCKGFVDSFVKTISLENATKNINCNSLQLGYFDGGLTHRIPEAFKDNILKNIPVKRWGSIEELHNTIEYLISTPYITGQSINISGGLN
jgi:NAD(P)-dependent dehydrogenase (short-subunit alcohol dehydrogenase family)